ncbi:MAG TPA: TniQ family protein [Ktedonobacteraceae bacterium]|nr:TniQ family protein [Ktedonobacteraceae bacterium]
MVRISLIDPAWKTTFPFLVEPRSDEWLTGLLLHCDEVNHWGSGTTLTHLCHLNEKTAKSTSTFIAPPGLDLSALADALAVPHEALLATTYQAELARIYGVADPHALLLSTSFSFRLCPACVAEDRLLTRTLVLPHITICPRHQIMLVDLCLCGTALRPFHWRALPFRCFKCSLSWAELPRNKAAFARIEIEEQLLSYYQFFWTYGTPEVLASTQRLVYDSVVEKGAIRAPLSDNISQSEAHARSYRRTSSLGYLVHLLWQLDLTPGDILVYAGPLPWRSPKWTRFQCEVSHCPYATILKARSNVLEAKHVDP